MAESGEPCSSEGCQGYLTTYATRTYESLGVRRRHLRCNKCQTKPENNVVTIPLRFAPKRRSPVGQGRIR